MQKKLKITLGVLLVIFSLGFVPSGARAQTAPDSNATPSYPVVSKRNPWAAYLRSCILPGWGQVYNGEKKKGVIMMGIFFPAVGLFIYEASQPDHEPTGPMFILDGLVIWSAVDAYISAKRINRLNGYGLSKSPSLQLGVYPSPQDPKKYQVGLALKKGF